MGRWNNFTCSNKASNTITPFRSDHVSWPESFLLPCIKCFYVFQLKTQTLNILPAAHKKREEIPPQWKTSSQVMVITVTLYTEYHFTLIYSMS